MNAFPYFFKTLATITGQKVIFPFYHAVADNVPIHLKPLYNVRSSKQFEEDLDTLLKIYKPISLSEFYKNLKGEVKIPKYAFHISFDDGLREFGDVAWPILKRKGIPASLFVNPSFVDNNALFFRFKAAVLLDYLKKNKEAVFPKQHY